MKPFHALHDRFKDHTRDKLCAGLQKLGLNAQVAPRGRPEERAIIWEDIFRRITGPSLWDIFSSVIKGSSLGIIDIKGEPIRWVSLRRYPKYPFLDDAK